MGRPKAALPLSHRADTFLSHIIHTLAAAGLPDVVVVTGANADVVRAAAGRVDSSVTFVHNAAWASGQLSSLLTGLTSGRVDHIEAALVTLVDVPLVRVDTVRRVVHEWRASGAPIVRPARDTGHGHPVIFDRAVFDELRTADPALGAKVVVRAHEADILNVVVDDPGAFLDLDTEEEYRRALCQLRP